MVASFLSLYLFVAALETPPLATAREVRSLRVEEARAGRAVALTGTVTFCPPRGAYFYLQDATGGLRVEWLADRQLRPGERVTVRGSTIAGSFLPEVKADAVMRPDEEPPAKDGLPEPVPYTLALENAGYMDGQWVEVIVVVQRVWQYEGWLQFDLARGRGHAVAYVPLPFLAQAQRAEAFAGAVMKIRGVCRVNANSSRQVAGPPRILVNDLSTFEVVRPAQADPFTLPITTARDLLPFRPDAIEARLPVHVSGVVTLNQGDRQFYIHDQTGIVHASSLSPEKVLPGDRVSVVGYPRLGLEPIRLDNAQVKVTGKAPLPAPVPGTPAQAREGKLEGQVVKFTGYVHEAGNQGGWTTLTLVADGLTFTVVVVPSQSGEGEWQSPVEDSKVEVTGVVTRQPLEGIRRTAFTVITERADIRVLEIPVEPAAPPVPSWWTGRRVAYLGVAALGFVLLSGASVAALRMQVRRATALVRKQYEEKEKLENQLKLAAKLEAVGRLAGGIAHDFNNLLTVINGAAQLLDEEIHSDPSHAAVLAAEIQRAGTQAAALTRQLLTFSRQRAVTPHPLDLNAVVTDAARVLERLMGERIAIRAVTEPTIPAVMADASLLSQILLNFAVNARDAMPNGGTLTFGTSLAEPGWVRLTASDTGMGMSEEVKARIFEPFFTTKEPGKGTGLGLSTVYGIVQTLGARIRFHSELGRGTSFEVDLPAAGAPRANTPPPPLAPVRLPAPPDVYEAPTAIAGNEADTVVTPVQPKLAASVVLLVEDDDAVRMLVHHVLEHAGLTVLAATAPDDALRLLSNYTGTIDLLITDVMMPGLSGRELAELVQHERPDLRVLFMSGYTADEILLQGVREDQVEFLHKPFVPRELLEQVRRILNKPRDEAETMQQ